MYKRFSDIYFVSVSVAPSYCDHIQYNRLSFGWIRCFIHFQLFASFTHLPCSALPHVCLQSLWLCLGSATDLIALSGLFSISCINQCNELCWMHINIVNDKVWSSFALLLVWRQKRSFGCDTRTGRSHIHFLVDDDLTRWHSLQVYDVTCYSPEASEWSHNCKFFQLLINNNLHHSIWRLFPCNSSTEHKLELSSQQRCEVLIQLDPV